MSAGKTTSSRSGGKKATEKSQPKVAASPTWPRSTKTLSFHRELEKGNKGERWMLQHYHSPLLAYREFAFDFLRDDGKRIEVKTDWYSLDKTEFFFIERWSSIEKKKPGGPWQSLGKADVWLYLFIRDGVYFEFDDMAAFVGALEQLIPDLELIRIPNKGYTGGGYKVPMKALAHLYTDYRLYWSVDDAEV